MAVYDLIDLGIDTSNIERELKSVSKKLGDFAKDKYQTKITADTKRAQKALEEYGSTVKGATGNVDTSVKADTSRAESQIKDFGRSLSDIDGKTASAKVDADFSNAESGLDTFVDDAEDKLSGLGSFISGAVGGALAGLAVGGLGSIITQVSETRDSMRTLRAITGATDEEFEQLKETSKTLYKEGIGTSISDVNRALGTATQQLGNFLDPEGIEEFLKGAGGIAKTFDEDINNVVARARPLISNFGLEGKEAVDLIALGMKDAGTASNDFLDTIDEYSPLLKSTGISAEQFVSTLTTGVQNGARNTDKLADSIKEAQIRLQAGDFAKPLQDLAKASTGAEKQVTQSVLSIAKEAQAGGISVFEALQLSQAKIKEAYDAGTISKSVREQLNVAIAGVPAEDIGADVFSKMFTADLDENQIKGKAKEAGELMADSVAPIGFEGLQRSIEVITLEIGQKLEPVFTKLGQAFQNISPIISGIANTLANTLAPVIGFIAENIKVFIPIIGGLTTALVATKAVGIIPTNISLKGLFQTLKANPIGAVITAISLLVSALVYAYNNSEAFRNIVDQMWAKIKEFAQALYTELEPVLKEIFSVLKTVGGILWDVFVYILKNGVIPVIKQWWNILVAVYTPIWNLAKIVGGVLVDNFKSMMKFVKESIETVQGFVDTVKNAFAAVGIGSKVKEKDTEVTEKNTESQEKNTDAMEKNAQENNKLNNSNTNLGNTLETTTGKSDSFGASIGNSAENTKSLKQQIDGLTKSLAEQSLAGEQLNSNFQEQLNKAVALTKEQNEYNAELKKYKELVSTLAGIDTSEITESGGVSQPGVTNIEEPDTLGSPIDLDQFDTATDKIDMFKVSLLEMMQANVDLENTVRATSEGVGLAISGMVTGSTTGLEMLSDIYNSVLDQLVEAALDYVQKQSLIWTAAIFGQEVSKLGWAGIATAGIITGILTGLIQTARAAVGAEEGVVGISEGYSKPPGKTDTIPAMLAPGEAVISASNTQKHKGLLNIINAGGNPYDYMKSQVSTNIAPSQTATDYSMLSELRGVNKRLNNLENATYYAASRSEHNYNFDVNMAKSKLRGSDIEQSFKVRKRRKIKGM